MEIFNHNSNFNFLGLRRFSIGLAILLMIGSIGLILTKGFNYGQDFVGGVAVEVEYQSPIDPADVRSALEKSGLENPLVQAVGGTRDFTIRMQPKDDKNSVALTGDEAAAKVAGDVVAALGLMTMGSGPIKGFGVTLFIGILTSMFTSVTVTHAITALIHGGRKLKTL